jgi:hypothetical protein
MRRLGTLRPDQLSALEKRLKAWLGFSEDQPPNNAVQPPAARYSHISVRYNTRSGNDG